MSSRTPRRPLARLWPALLVCFLACNSAEVVDPPGGDPPGDPNTPNNPNNPNSPSGFSIITLLHGTQNGASDVVRDVALDAQGNIYVTGGSNDRNFPTTANAYQRTFGRGQPTTSAGNNGNYDAFVMKFTPDGQLVWSTLLGGGNYDRGYGIEVDGSGVYVGGRAGEGFPTTGGTVHPTFLGGSNVDGLHDGFIAKLSLDGSTLLWSTFFGGPGNEYLRDLAVDAAGDLYPAVAIGEPGFPHIGAGAYQPTNRGLTDGVVCRIAAGATSVRWCTFIGGSGEDGIPPTVRVDGAGNVYYVQTVKSANMPTTAGAYQTTFGGGQDVHLSKFSPQGALLFATYYGGSGTDAGETHNLWVTPNGEAYVVGSTNSTNLPLTSGAFQARSGGGYDGFIAHFSADGRQLLAATYLGASGGDAVEGIGMDAAGNVVVAGTSSGGLPTAGAPQPNAAGGGDGFIAVISPGLASVIRATYLGGSGLDASRTIAVDRQRQRDLHGRQHRVVELPDGGHGIPGAIRGSRRVPGGVEAVRGQRAATPFSRSGFSRHASRTHRGTGRDRRAGARRPCGRRSLTSGC